MTPPISKLVPILVAMVATVPVLAQPSEMMRFEIQQHSASSGKHEGQPGPLLALDESVNRTREFMTIIRSPGVNLLRVHFDDFDLGGDRGHSRIRITSLQDGAVQYFSHKHLVEWDGWSAIFNGDAVVVELFVASGESDIFFEVVQISVNHPPAGGAGPPDGGIAALCGGTDLRIASSNPRVGRLSGAGCAPGGGGNCGGCTAWLASIGSAISAGHCNGLFGGLIEFNVPMSQSDGTPVASHPDHQYPVAWYAYQDGEHGFDWAILWVFANSNTGLRPHWAQNHFHLSPVLPANGATIRITGHGVDNVPTGSNPGNCCAWNDAGACTHNGCNSSSLTQQTATGPKTDHTTNRYFYAADTEPANSGSPIIRNVNGFAIGVHTHGGCVSTGSNSGTRITQSAFETWLNGFLNGATFVEHANVSSFELGSALHPARTLPFGIALASAGGTVAIAGGSYTASAGNTGTFTKAVTLTAISGVVTIGN